MWQPVYRLIILYGIPRVANLQGFYKRPTNMLEESSDGDSGFLYFEMDDCDIHTMYICNKIYSRNFGHANLNIENQK